VLKNKSVLFIGDSITSDNIGYRVSVTRAADLTAYDASISGGISSMMLYDAKAIIEKHRPDIVSVMIGTNDSACVDTAPTVSIDEYVRNVKSIIGWGKQNGAEILLFAVPPISETRFNIPLKTQTNDNIGRYNEALQGVANDNDIRLISNEWVNKSEDMLEPDGVHLSVEGQKIFSEKWIVAAAQIFNERLMKG
jgi:lysophospholipase L1-like esterase